VSGCPVGIDIRDGLQYECIGCAVCIDACDEVMDKVGMQRGLVRYSSENALEKGWKKKEIVRRALRARTMIYGFILLAICSAFIWGLATRTPLRVDVIPDRVSFGREIPGGLIENDFQLQVMNMSEKQRSFVFKVTGLPDARIRGEERVTVGAAQNYLATLQVQVPITAGKPGTNGKIFFEISPEDEPGLIAREKATFFFPQ
jgi:polyferredoxin